MTRWLLVAVAAGAAAGCGTAPDPGTAGWIAPPPHPPGYDACVEVDTSPPMGASVTRRRTFDADGDVVHEDWSWLSSTWSVDYANVDGRPTEVDYANPDGSMQRIDRYTYDERGREIRFDQDGDIMSLAADGHPDQTTFYQWDEDDRLVRVSQDDNLDGVPDADDYETRRFDRNGCILSVDIHARSRTLVRYATMPDCRTLRVDYDTGGDGVIDDWQLYDYDAAGRLIAIRSNFDKPITFTYDAAGRLTSESLSGETLVYTYDCPST